MAEFQDYPKWLPEFGCVALNAQEEQGLRDGQLEVEVRPAAEGAARVVVPKKNTYR